MPGTRALGLPPLTPGDLQTTCIPVRRREDSAGLKASFLLPEACARSGILVVGVLGCACGRCTLTTHCSLEASTNRRRTQNCPAPLRKRDDAPLQDPLLQKGQMCWMIPRDPLRSYFHTRWEEPPQGAPS